MKNLKINLILISTLCVMFGTIFSMEHSQIPFDDGSLGWGRKDEKNETNIPTKNLGTKIKIQKRTITCPFNSSEKTQKAKIERREQDGEITYEFSCPHCTNKPTIELVRCPGANCSQLNAIQIPLEDNAWNCQCTCGYNKNSETPIDALTNQPSAKTSSKGASKNIPLALGLISIVGTAGYGLYKFFTSGTTQDNDLNELARKRLSRKLEVFKKFAKKHLKSALIGGMVGLSLFTALTLGKANLSKKGIKAGLPCLLKKNNIINNRVINAGLSIAGGALSAATYNVFNKRNRLATQV